MAIKIPTEFQLTSCLHPLNAANKVSAGLPKRCEAIVVAPPKAFSVAEPPQSASKGSVAPAELSGSSTERKSMDPRSASSAKPLAPLIALAANSAWNILNFRGSLIGALRAQGYRVVVLVPPGEGVANLHELGVEVALVPMRPRGISPIADCMLALRYRRVLKRFQPDAFLGFTAKPNIFGSLAASSLGIPVINNITGLGTGFLSGRLLQRVLTSLYKSALRKSALVLFHNSDDQRLFVERNLVRTNRTRVIPGSGVDLKYFTAASAPPLWPPTFLFIGRLLIDKGIMEFGEAAELVRNSVPSARFVIVGGESTHPKAAPRGRLRRWAQSGVIDLIGSVDDVRPLIEDADCVVLPSYREGLPRVLLEASAMARPVIATDVPGCREIVEDGVTGYLCDVRSAESLAAAMFRFLRLSDDERAAMGQRARRRAQERFGEERVIQAYGAALRGILGENFPRG